MISSIDSLKRPKVWMARRPAVRVFEQRVEMFQKGRWWAPVVSMSFVLAGLACVVARFDFTQQLLGLWMSFGGVMMIVVIGMALWFRKEGPILIFDRRNASLSIPGHRLVVPASALAQFHIRDVRCPDGEGGTYVSAALAMDSESASAPFCVYVWSRAALEPVLLQFRTEVEKMMSESPLPTKTAVN